MTDNIQNAQIELIEKKFNIGSLLIGLICIALGGFAFVYSRNLDGNMLSSLMIFVGIILVAVALFFIIAKLNNTVYTKTKSPIVKRQLYFDTADFYNIKSVVENNDFKSIEKFNRVDEGNVQLYVLHSKDKKFAALQLLKYEPFDFVPQTEIKVQEF
ncbi:MAG: hypothetical protein IJZ87_05605 [Bacteroidales bacterium]|nr:hypothetical protein [Bacteroidales bacterium]